MSFTKKQTYINQLKDLNKYYPDDLINLYTKFITENTKLRSKDFKEKLNDIEKYTTLLYDIREGIFNTTEQHVGKIYTKPTLVVDNSTKMGWMISTLHLLFLNPRITDAPWNGGILGEISKLYHGENKISDLILYMKAKMWNLDVKSDYFEDYIYNFMYGIINILTEDEKIILSNMVCVKTTMNKKEIPLFFIVKTDFNGFFSEPYPIKIIDYCLVYFKDNYKNYNDIITITDKNGYNINGILFSTNTNHFYTCALIDSVWYRTDIENYIINTDYLEDNNDFIIGLLIKKLVKNE